MSEAKSPSEQRERVDRIVMPNPMCQIKQWVDGNYDQWQFWLTVVSSCTYDGLGLTEEEAWDLAGYYRGRYELAKQFRDLVNNKAEQA